MYKSILLPIDLAHLEKSRAAVNTAKGVAGENTKVRLLNVVGDVPTFVAAELPGGVIDKAKGKAVAALTDLAKATYPKADTEVRSGTPYAAILAAAEECGADLIIIGSHQPGIQDYLLGSTAARVVRHANCSVLVVR